MDKFSTSLPQLHYLIKPALSNMSLRRVILAVKRQYVNSDFDVYFLNSEMECIFVLKRLLTWVTHEMKVFF